MVQGSLPIGNTLRLATIVEVEKTFVVCKYLGKFAENEFDCPMPQPYAGKGSGILAGIEKDSVVLVSEGPSEQKFIVSFVPIRAQYFDQEGIDDVPFDNTPFPELEQGQFVIKSSGGSYIDIHPDGDIVLDAGAGDHEADLELSGDSRAFITRTDNRYSFTEASRRIEGIVRRDKHQEENPMDTTTFDFLVGEGYDELLETIGRLPQYEAVNSSTVVGRDFVRNPPLIEKREIVYEYAHSSGLAKLSDEVREMFTVGEEEEPDRSAGLRQDRRTDVLNLNLRNYNHLIEKVEGTLVDIYGNILDVNRNVIDIPDLETLGYSNNEPDIKKALQTIYNYMRRSVKYHLEINSRKDIVSDEPVRTKGNINQREHSRWSIDVDGEGLTKINIPASSDTGNIPVLGRYITSRDENTEQIDDDDNSRTDPQEDGAFRDPKEKDIRMAAFGVGGPSISNSSYVPETVDDSSVTAGTAYHDLAQVASSIFSGGAWGQGNRISSSIKNKIGDNDANAGGRSVHANLDGSMELSIGADTIDSKSLMLDLEGGVVSHYGADSGGRSIIHQSDGSILMQIGSSGSGDQPGNPGRLEIHLSNGSGGAQKIIIDEGGMTFDVQGSIIFNASANIGLNAGAEMMINGAHVSVFGSVDASPGGTRMVNPGGTTIVPTGLPHLGFLG